MSDLMLNVAIIGARAFTALELLKILLRHPNVRVAALQARVDEPMPIGDVFGSLRGAELPLITEVDVDALPDDIDAVFLCLPHTVGAEYAMKLADKNVRIFDLSADFRYRNHKTYEATYGVTHPSPEMNLRAVYGLPEFHRARIIDAKLVACPGCYPTSVTLSVGPLMKHDMIVKNSIIADCKSGVSGAGRTPTEGTHFCTVNEGFTAYKVANHRHQTEIEEQLSRLAGIDQTITFVPHLVPMDRGILATVYSQLTEPIEESAIRKIYQQFYKNEPFIRVMPEGVFPNTKHVSNTNMADIAVRVDSKAQRLIVTTAIDNLVKGASGQAVQCFNVSFQLSETAGFC